MASRRLILAMSTKNAPIHPLTFGRALVRMLALTPGWAQWAGWRGIPQRGADGYQGTDLCLGGAQTTKQKLEPVRCGTVSACVRSLSRRGANTQDQAIDIPPVIPTERLNHQR
jgi:hypothetical protein